MSITIDWPASNVGVATAVRIYASTSKMADDALGDPIATLAGTETSYVWNPPTDNTVYYFRIAIDRGADSYLSPNQPYGYFTTTGPGPQQLVRGSWEAGYFGRVPSADFISQTNLLSALGFSGGSGPNADGAINHYYKFALKGKIIFVPCGSIRWSITWDQIYALGLMYGVDGTGLDQHPAGSNLVGVNQKKIVAIQGYNFMVRTFKGATTPTTDMIPNLTNFAAIAEGSEWDLTMGRINTNGTLPFNTNALWDDNLNAPVNTGVHQGTITQHQYGAVVNNRISVVRGPSGTCDGFVAGTPQGQITTWNPILELQF